MRLTSWVTLAVTLLAPRTALATVLTLEDALDRARREAPAVLAVRIRLDEARGRLAGASTLLRDNPVLEGAAGPRYSHPGVSTDVDTSLTVPVEVGGRRRARIAGAEAEVEQEAAQADDTTRRLLADVAVTFVRAVAARDRLRVLRAADEVAAELLRVAERRHRAGDVADLEANIARVAASRARADVEAAEAVLERGLGDLRALLGLEATEALVVQGDLGARRLHPLEDLLATAPERPDLRALAAEVRAAEAEVRLGEGLAWPDLGLRLAYKHEEGDDIPMAGLSVSLPVFARGQDLRGAGAARARRLRIELEARRRTIEVEIRAAFASHQRLVAGVDALERRALPLLADNDALARRSYEAGELGLGEYLVVRRETLGARLDYVDRSLEARLAAIDLESRAGVLR